MGKKIEKLYGGSDDRPILVMEKMLARLSKIKYTEIATQASTLLTGFCETILKTCNIDDNLWKDDPINGLFNDKFGRHDKRFIAICLLRLLNINDKPFENEGFRVRTFKLFDEMFSSDIYPRLDINPKDQTYQKRSKLQDSVLKIEKELSELMDSFGNLELLSSFRQKFMQKLKKKMSKAVLWPFLPRELLEIRLDEVFSIVEDYLKESEMRRLQRFEKAKEILGMYYSETREYGTKYSLDYLGSLAKKLKGLLENHFKLSPTSKPGDLVIEGIEKKYPFHIVGKESNLSFAVRNCGTGYAFDVDLQLEASIPLRNDKLYLGRLEPAPASVEIEIPCQIAKAEKSVLVLAEIIWSNFDGSTQRKSFDFQLEGQRTDLDWETLDKEDPYSLEPVTTEEDLVGRREILNQLESLIKPNSIGSAFIYGQKRVGKTSVVKTLKTHLEKVSPPEFFVIYLEGGDYINPNPQLALRNLGEKLCKEIRTSDKRLANLDIPKFEGALSPLTDFLDSVIRIVPNFRIFFILDEFDDLPIGLYRGEFGHAFFLTIRSISGKPPFGFILVGGEKMELVINWQGDVLNKFQAIRVDYFDRDRHWADFQDLVRRPISKWLEITDKALSGLYDETAGNPYFTKIICKELFSMMVERRDCYVTHREIKEATKKALQTAKVNAFEHFWTDGVFLADVHAEEIRTKRRKLLLSLAEAIRKYKNAGKEHIMEAAKKLDLSEISVESELREFDRREVLVLKDNAYYKCKVKFVEKWLIEKGVRDIIIAFPGADEFLRRKGEEERLRVTPKEVMNVVKNWGAYKGRPVTEDQVRAWLDQFGDNKKQRLMFRILQNITFYTADSIRAKMKDIHGIVKRGLVWRIDEKKRKRSDILVSYLDYLGKSGAYLARLYADENDIYYKNIIERAKITEILERKAKQLPAFALVFVDDFIGTGNSACEYFESLNEKHWGILKKLSKEPGEIEGTSKLQMFFITISGFQESQAKIEKILEKLGLSVKVHICEPLDESAKAFSDKSRIFPDPTERTKARQIVYEHGVQLIKNAPLGYGNCQATIVFEHRCPNNTLSILWGESGSWSPLFKRL